MRQQLSFRNKEFNLQLLKDEGNDMHYDLPSWLKVIRVDIVHFTILEFCE